MYKEDRSSFWENIYLDNDARWDLGEVTPVFDRISEEFNIGRVLFIGCGRGYDAIMFAKNSKTGKTFLDTKFTTSSKVFCSFTKAFSEPSKSPNCSFNCLCVSTKTAWLL